MKIIKGIVLLYCLTFLQDLTGQVPFPSVYEINSDTAVAIRLDDAYWQMLEDTEGKWTIDEVSRSPIADKFHANTTKTTGILSVDYSIHTYWMRYRFKNAMKHEVRIIIPKDVTNADFYTLGSDGKWNHKKTGTTVPWSERDDLKRTTTVIYTIQPGEELLFYERDNFDYSINTPDYLQISFGFTDKAIQKYYAENDSSILPSFLFGFFLLAALFNLYFFIIIRRYVYLFFSLTLFFRGFSRFLWANDVFFKEYPIVKCYLADICNMLFFFFLIHFLRYFLETFKHFPRWDKYLVGLSIYFVIFRILREKNILPFKYEDLLGPAIVLIFFIITFILFLRSGLKVVKLPIVATLPIIGIMSIPSIVVLFTVLNDYNGMPMPSLLKWVWANNRFSVLEQSGLAWLLIFLSWSLLQRYQQLQKRITDETLAKEKLEKEQAIERNQLIAQQKVQLEKEVKERTAELSQSLKELKATQNQLIQKEKLASLGELTAGIAHEIQNPLNFVNNFSELSIELIDELKSPLTPKGGTLETELLSDISQNLEKINHHGKRASNIVKGMLEHSRASTGVKELTDINKLADEYLRLAYHGMRAKDKDFNADFTTDFDENLTKIEVIPQDMGRVLLNLFNNAFYAVNLRQQQLCEGLEPSQSLSTYTPSVSVTTQQLDNQIIIKVKDNGMGMPESVRAKVFQPFFTTKPTGQGTGLGLSLAYDIVTKGHGGSLEVESTEGVGSEFVIKLPI